MKISFFVIIATLSAFPSYGQDIPESPWQIEIGAGINHILTHVDGVEKRVGIGISIKKIWLPEKRYNIISGLVVENTKYYDNNIHCPGHLCTYKDGIKFNTYYLIIPLMFRYNLGNKYKIFMEAGPSFEIVPFKWGKGIESTYFPISGDVKEIKISGDFEHDFIDAGLNSGLGVIFPLRNYNIILSLGYHNSFISLIESEAKQNNMENFLTLKTGIQVRL